MLNNVEIEKLEEKYLNKIYYLLKYMEEEIIDGFLSKEKIKDDWKSFWNIQRNGQGMSDFDRGAERIVYSILNGKIVGSPNSSPVGSDLMFETKDAFIHIDLKTVNSNNIGDGNTSIFVGENQNSYRSTINKVNNNNEEYRPHLPTFYNINKPNQKICLTYFIVVLWDSSTLDTIAIYIICMPNGKLESHYKGRVLKAGKNPGKARFNFKEVDNFELLSNGSNCKKRIKIIHLNEKYITSKKYKNKLKFLYEIYKKQCQS